MELHSELISVLDVAAQILIAVALACFAWSQHWTTIKIDQIQRIHQWGKKCLGTFSKCEHFLKFHINKEDNESFESRRLEIMEELSSLIEQGRLLYGNVRKGEHGCGKYPPYQGYRPVILDPLLAVYGAMTAIGEGKSQLGADTLDKIKMWRKFYLALLHEDVDSTWLMRKVSSHTAKEVPGYSVSGRYDPPSPPSWQEYEKYVKNMK